MNRNLFSRTFAQNFFFFTVKLSITILTRAQACTIALSSALSKLPPEKTPHVIVRLLHFYRPVNFFARLALHIIPRAVFFAPLPPLSALPVPSAGAPSSSTMHVSVTISVAGKPAEITRSFKPCVFPCMPPRKGAWGARTQPARTLRAEPHCGRCASPTRPSSTPLVLFAAQHRPRLGRDPGRH